MDTGKITRAVLDRSVLRPLKLAGVAGPEDRFGTDGAPCGAASMATTVSAPMCGTLDPTPRMLLISAVNSLAAAGGTATEVMIGVLFPEQAEEKMLQKLMRAFADNCKELGLTVAGGHTEVTDAVTRPAVTVTAIGSRTDAGEGTFPGTPKDGDALIMAGHTGMAGAAVLAEVYEERLKEHFPWTLADEAQRFSADLLITEAARIALEDGATAMHDISQGGVFGALWELGEQTDMGFRVDLKKIPVRQETVEICEQFELNPYQLYGQGGLFITAPRAERIVSRLRERGIMAAVVGYMTEQPARVLVNGEEERFLDKPAQDMLRKMEKEEAKRRIVQ